MSVVVQVHDRICPAVSTLDGDCDCWQRATTEKAELKAELAKRDEAERQRNAEIERLSREVLAEAREELSIEKTLEAKVVALTEVLKQAQKAITQAHNALSMKAHALNCNIVFHGCDCGSFENFEPERAEFYRQKNNLEISKALGE